MIPADLTSKFSALERAIANDRGSFVLFALFLREDLPDRWDLIASAPWITDQKAALDYFVARIRQDMGPDELTKLSRIVLVKPDDAAVLNLNKAFSVEHGAIEVRDSNLFGLPIKHAFIITSKAQPTQPPSAPAPN